MGFYNDFVGEHVEMKPLIYSELNDWFHERGIDDVKFGRVGDGSTNTISRKFIWLILPNNGRGYMYISPRKSMHCTPIQIGDNFYYYKVLEYGLMGEPI